MSDYLPDSWPAAAAIAGALVVLIDLGLRVAALGIIPGGRKPSTGMAWLLVILLAPLLGFTAFLLLGTTRVGRKRHLKQKEVNDAISARIDAADLPEATVAGPAYLTSVATLNRKLGALPVVGGNEVELISDYSESIAAMTEAVGKANHHVHVEFYICAWDDLTGPLFEELARAAARGVEVRLLFDHLGSKGIPGYKEMLERLRGSGVQWHPMLPIEPLHGRFRRPDLRNHRKLLVVDGLVGFTGSQNLTEPGYNKPKNHKLGRKWVELMCRLEGPVVTALEAVFAGDWYAETDERLRVEALAEVSETGVPAQLVPSGPGFVTENNLRMFNTLLYSAQRRISLTSPYFVPDESLLYAVTTAAQRGVAVELFVSEQSDQFMVGHAQASYYRALLEAGVEIYLYPPPFVLHSKHFTIDDDVAVLGSSNMDMRSFALNYELSLMLVGPDVVRRMREVEDAYRARSRRLTLEEWGERSPRLRYVDNVMRLTAALQ
jgi:cardiolipin synthase A/B